MARRMLHGNTCEIVQETDDLAEGDILDPNRFTELPILDPGSIFRFVRDGRHLSDSRLQSIGGRPATVLELLPEKGYAVVIASRWSVIQFKKHFGIPTTRAPPAEIDEDESEVSFVDSLTDGDELREELEETSVVPPSTTTSETPISSPSDIDSNPSTSQDSSFVVPPTSALQYC